MEGANLGLVVCSLPQLVQHAMQSDAAADLIARNTATSTATPFDQPVRWVGSGTFTLLACPVSLHAQQQSGSGSVSTRATLASQQIGATFMP